MGFSQKRTASAQIYTCRPREYFGRNGRHGDLPDSVPTIRKNFLPRTTRNKILLWVATTLIISWMVWVIGIAVLDANSFLFDNKQRGSLKYLVQGKGYVMKRTVWYYEAVLLFHYSSTCANLPFGEATLLMEPRLRRLFVVAAQSN